VVEVLAWLGVWCVVSICVGAIVCNVMRWSNDQTSGADEGADEAGSWADEARWAGEADGDSVLGSGRHAADSAAPDESVR